MADVGEAVTNQSMNRKRAFPLHSALLGVSESEEAVCSSGGAELH